MAVSDAALESVWGLGGQSLEKALWIYGEAFWGVLEMEDFSGAYGTVELGTWQF